MQAENGRLRNALSSVDETPEAVFRMHARNDVTLVWAIGGTLLGAVVALAFASVTVFLLIRSGAVGLLTAVPAAGAIALLSVFARELFVRLRRMGDFVLDARARTLSRPGGATLGAIRALRPSTRFGVAVPQTGVSWWIVAEMEGGSAYRIARGAWGEVRSLLLRFRQLGLPVEAIDEALLLRTFGSSVTRLDRHRFQFHSPEAFAKVVAPAIVAFWILFAAMFVAGPIVSRAPTQTWLYMSPFFVFFVAGITIGILNTVHFHRRSGTFLVDTSGARVYRNGVLVAQRNDGSRFVTGNPSQRGVSSARKGLGSAVGPQVLAVQLAGGRTFNLLRGMPGDVRYAAELLREQGVTVVDL